MNSILNPKHVQPIVSELRQLRDEIGVQLHLATMEARDRWEKLEPQLDEAQRLALDVSAASYRAMEEIAARFRAFRAELEEANRRQRH